MNKTIFIALLTACISIAVSANDKRSGTCQEAAQHLKPWVTRVMYNGLTYEQMSKNPRQVPTFGSQQEVLNFVKKEKDPNVTPYNLLPVLKEMLLTRPNYSGEPYYHHSWNALRSLITPGVDDIGVTATQYFFEALKSSWQGVVENGVEGLALLRTAGKLSPELQRRAFILSVRTYIDKYNGDDGGTLINLILLRPKNCRK